MSQGDILKLLGNHKKGLTIIEISKILNLSRSPVSSSLRTMWKRKEVIRINKQKLGSRTKTNYYLYKLNRKQNN